MTVAQVAMNAAKVASPACVCASHLQQRDFWQQMKVGWVVVLLFWGGFFLFVVVLPPMLKLHYQLCCQHEG